MTKKAVIILSGGLDSTTCMGIAEREGYTCYPLTFDYGQRHKHEVEQAKKVAAHYEVPQHKIVDIAFLGQIGGSALTDSSIEVPDYTGSKEVPVTYVPARNMIFLSLAAAYAEVVGAEAIYIGVSSVDYSGYPDCRPEFIRSMTETINLATQAGIKEGNLKILAPLSHLSKAQTIQLGIDLNVPYHLTTSCYRGGESACGTCDSCKLRLQGFEQAGAKDPIPYM
ncbi:7-cyano-7-deazaguanine synthase QueC [Ammoniphilus sp. CFH 90114]|uniref:7-cyano-7-deazaguanine synthase QueC n=1 Tax=Ammoniphilus sp. CFH 90114 TaxID=2493665 RepID=UPI00100F87FF|nr:7-cyano-7-deazaguanine synthase QueC [Ammoniphilus sp. CFH 90114]RXT04151.1 7-cyano-7-deazaguanine synthase QueC [Ammoniphilus sp. CFH 90114]